MSVGTNPRIPTGFRAVDTSSDLLYTLSTESVDFGPRKASVVFFRQVLYRDLGCASYVVGHGGEAVVVDPRWDIEVYLEIARAERLRITHVIETHDHADHVSGRFRLADATGARIHQPFLVGAQRADAIAPGDEITVGDLRIRALGTPGHRPEHLSFVVSDRTRGDDPWMVLTGDSLLIGDLARPDLAVDASDGATGLYSSMSPLLALGDHVEVWPAHVGGSLCGGSGLSHKTSSTVGFERLHNPLLMMEEEQFVKSLVEGIPSRPPNVQRIVALNAAPAGDDPGDVALINSERLIAALRAGATVLDARSPDEFDVCHLAGAVNLPAASAGVGTRAGWVLAVDAPTVIAASTPQQAEQMASALHAVGLWATLGYTIVDRWAWEKQSLPVATADSWSLERLASGLRGHECDLVDVRDNHEWQAGHVPGSHHLPLQSFRVDRPVALPQTGLTTAVACAAGVRAAFAASLLRRGGRRDVVRIAGGGVPDLDRLGINLAVGLA
jgi:glyoxylase-like metal-dependent hydrolase (beta-lactamase superfamily II)/rhodanese-related sulfurtransferase